MKKFFNICSAAIILFANIVTAQTNDSQIIENTLNEWIESFNKKDIEKSLTIFSPDFIGYYPDQKEQTAKDMAEQYRHILSNSNLAVKLELKIIEIKTSGSLAFVNLELKASIKPTYSPQPQIAYDKGIQIWEKNSNGEWRLTRSSTFPFSGQNAR